jgi:hypothetical protein
VHRVELPAGRRAPGIPPDTAGVPFETWVNGHLLEPARLGEVAAVRTASGRLCEGRIVEADPGYTHSFGPPPDPLRAAGRRAAERLR